MKRRDQRLGMLGAVLLLLAVLCSPGPSHAVAATDPVLAWNMIMRTTVMSSTVTVTNAFMQGRSASMMHLAVFEAVNAIVGGYEPYLGTIAAPPGASPEAAAIAAAHRTLVLLHPDMELSLNAARATALAAIAPSTAKDAGIAVGEAAAEAIVHLRANDGAASADLLVYTPGTEPGDYQVTPGSMRARFVGWGQVTTFGIEGGAQFRSVPPPAIHTGKYARDYNEVQRIGSTNSTVRSQHQTDLGRYFGVNFPLHVFNEAAIQASVAQGTSLAENARIFALLNMAIADALISSMESKYYYEYWRPVTAIRAGDTDGNKHTAADPGWLPLVAVTPPYPSYPSNYASAAHAAGAVLAESYGNGGHAITLTSGSTTVDVTLHYTTFSQLSDDATAARVYGGIHFRFDQDAGSRMGRHVGSYLLRNQLRPVHGQG